MLSVTGSGLPVMWERQKSIMMMNDLLWQWLAAGDFKYGRRSAKVNLLMVRGIEWRCNLSVERMCRQNEEWAPLQFPIFQPKLEFWITTSTLTQRGEGGFLKAILYQPSNLRSSTYSHWFKNNNNNDVVNTNLWICLQIPKNRSQWWFWRSDWQGHECNFGLMHQ